LRKDATQRSYSKKKFAGNSDRVAFLFELYQQLTARGCTTAKDVVKDCQLLTIGVYINISTENGGRHDYEY
jgi:hypothetical protein